MAPNEREETQMVDGVGAVEPSDGRGPDVPDQAQGSVETTDEPSDVAAEAGDETPDEAATRLTDLDALETAGELRAAAETLKEELGRSQRESEEHLEHLQRVQAEFQNYKKRMMREQTEIVERASTRLVEALLPALESLDLAVESAAGYEPVLDGLEAMRAQVTEILDREGLERIEPEAGTAVDPELHEPVARSTDMDAAREAEGQPTVTKVLRPGYRLKGRLLRPAMVEFAG